MQFRGIPLAVAAISVCFYAATTLADTVAQSLFVTSVGVAALPNIFLGKAVIDVLSALIYLPLTRGRDAKRVWQTLLVLYVLSLCASWAWLQSSPSVPAAYFTYVAHETTWTLLVIHWGILLLSLWTTRDSHRRFPILFALGRSGALLGGLIVGASAGSIGSNNLLLIAGALASTAIACTHILGRPNAREATAPETTAPETLGDKPGSWRSAWSSPLVRAIALSTALMVVLRYGLRMVSLEEIRVAFDGERDGVTSFLGLFSAIGNAAAMILGLLVVPKFLARFGVGVANLSYAGSVVGAFALSSIIPGLASACSARFVENPLKHALRTPISVLFYGAEPAGERGPARALIFGMAIPLAAVAAGLLFRIPALQGTTLAYLGTVLALCFFAACHVQNHRYRKRLIELLPHVEGQGTEEEPALEAIPGLSAQEARAIAQGLRAGPELASRARAALVESVPARRRITSIRELTAQSPTKGAQETQTEGTEVNTREKTR